MEDGLKTIIKDDLKKNGRQPPKKWKKTSKKMEDDLNHNVHKLTLIGRDIILN
jgi:hypothetical protein